MSVFNNYRKVAYDVSNYSCEVFSILKLILYFIHHDKILINMMLLQMINADYPHVDTVCTYIGNPLCVFQRSNNVLILSNSKIKILMPNCSSSFRLHFTNIN